MEDIKRLVGEQIRNLRKRRGLSQEELGWKSELHYTYIGALERGEKNWSIDTLSKIAKGLDVTIHELFNFPSTPPDVNKLKVSITKEIKICSPDMLCLFLDLIKRLKELETKATSKNPKKL